MTPNPKGVMEKNNKLMMSMDKKRESNRVASEKKRTTSDGYMPTANQKAQGITQKPLGKVALRKVGMMDKEGNTAAMRAKAKQRNAQ